MKRFAAACLGAALALTLVAGPVGATGGAYCNDSFYWYDGHNSQSYSAGYYDEVLWSDGGYSGYCIGFNSSQTNLGNWYDTGTNQNWNDRTSSYKFDTNNCHYRTTLYANTGYNLVILTVHGGLGSGGFPPGWNDATSSVGIYYNNSCPG